MCLNKMEQPPSTIFFCNCLFMIASVIALYLYSGHKEIVKGALFIGMAGIVGLMACCLNPITMVALSCCVHAAFLVAKRYNIIHLKIPEQTTDGLIKVLNDVFGNPQRGFLNVGAYVIMCLQILYLTFGLIWIIFAWIKICRRSSQLKVDVCSENVYTNGKYVYVRVA